MEIWTAAFIFVIVIVYLVMRIIAFVAASRRSKREPPHSNQARDTQAKEK